MIKAIDSRIYPNILHLFASMGHGDTVVLSDANFPSHSVASATVWQRLEQWSIDAITALELTLSVIPIDTYDLDTPAVIGMQVVGEPNTMPEVMQAAEPILQAHNSHVTLIERHAFYAEAKKAFAVIRTSEARPYGNLIIRKGVV